MQKEEVLGSMGALSAWSQIRSSGYKGAASSEEIAHFASDENWASRLIQCAFEMARLFQDYYRDYCHAFDDRVFEKN